ncbi:dihydrofolate reductase family protein [Mucilaginibacter puniceus]
MANIVYIATSIDGYIAKSDGGIDWLNEIPNTQGSDYGFGDFMKRIDGILMGRSTYEIVMDFETWFYPKPVYVLSNSWKELPGKWAHKAQLVKGDILDVVNQLNQQGVLNLYIDGGKTIQSLLAADKIDEMIITRVPIVLGAGIPLFTPDLPELKFEHTATETYEGGLVKSSYIRKR